MKYRIASISIIFFCLILLISCSNDGNKHPTPPEKSNELLRSQMRGKWGGETPEQLGWDIREDSIYYYNHKASYPYYLKGDTLSVKFPDRDTVTIFGSILVENDTLKLFSIEDSVTYFLRH